tara:strand:- start:1079 stop:1972 length:894 start_codon:yes stop_codon:yes gene_type:complete
MTVIIAIGGKKGSGKTSLSCYLSAVVDNIVRNDSRDVCNLCQSEDNPRSVYLSSKSEFDIYDFSKSVTRGIVRTYSFADELKNFLLSSFDVSREQVYGSDNEKNIKTKYRWDTLPSFTRWINSPLKKLRSKTGANSFVFANKKFINSITTEADFLKALCWGWVPEDLRTGHMTARELMQVLGTDIGRKMFNNDIWVDATLGKIKKESPKIAIIDDLRFCSEADAVLGDGGFVVVLSRNKNSLDIHGSEKDLDNFDTDSDGVIFIDNMCSIDYKNKECLSFVIETLKNEVSNDFSKQV